MPQSSRFAPYLVGIIVVSLYGLPAVASDDFGFYHENVMGTSLELHVRCDSEDAARRAEACVLGEIDRLAAIFSGYDSGKRVFPLASGRQGFRSRSPRSFTMFCWRARAGESEAAAPSTPGSGVCSRLWTGCAQLGRLPRRREPGPRRRILKTPAWRLVPDGAAGRAPVGLPGQSRRHRQGLYRRAGLRKGLARNRRGARTRS